MSRILIVEDEPRIAAFIEKGLRGHGFTPTVVSNGQESLALALDLSFDLMILDLYLPDQDGFTVLETLRGRGITLPIIILTVRDEIDHKVAAFESGADDYLTKPFRFEELLARIRARLRSPLKPSTRTTSANIVSQGLLTINLLTQEVWVRERSIQLSAREFVLLETFMRHPKQIMSREQLLELVWGYAYDPGSNVVDVYVGNLRKKLGRDVIETVRGMGYRLTSESS
jgi:DNA-binding response OmpR family regulator